MILQCTERRTTHNLHSVRPNCPSCSEGPGLTIQGLRYFQTLDFLLALWYILNMNKLPELKRNQVLHMLVEGSSMRSISRVVGVSMNTIVKLLQDAGEAALEYHDAHVQELSTKRVECDEIWSFCYSKQKNAPKITGEPEYAGDVWTWTALDSDSKLLIAWLVSTGRDSDFAIELMDDVRNRLSNRVQLTTDGHRPYLEAVEGCFWWERGLCSTSETVWESSG